MKLYKYRDLSDEKVGLSRIDTILRARKFWCARPDTLNDPAEFYWTCDFTESAYTEELLARLLTDTRGYPRDQARIRANLVLKAGSLGTVGEGIFASLINQCRDEIGLACFGDTAENDVLWERYAAGGVGVCIEVEVPDRLWGTQLYKVQYQDKKTIHIDTFLRSWFDDRKAKQEMYNVSMLTKPKAWTSEGEIRFLSKVQNVEVLIQDSVITRVVVGDKLSMDTRAAIQALEPSIQMVHRLRSAGA